MKNRKFVTSALFLIAVAFLISLTVKKGDNLWYFWDRWKNGSEFRLNGTCMRLPKNWAFLEPPKDSTSVTVLHYFQPTPYFASIQGKDDWIRLKGKLNVSDLGGVAIAEGPLEVSPKDRQHFAYSDTNGAFITSRTSASAIELASALRPCDAAK